jgi:hypothetical protein
MVLHRKTGLAVVALAAGIIATVGITAVSQATHLRPKSAPVVRESLIPAHKGCVSPNNTHNPPLALPSCSPAVGGYGPFLTIGTPDVNGLPVGMNAGVKLQMVLSPPDMLLQASIDDQYCTPAYAGPCTSTGESLRDYVGGLNVDMSFRLTDHRNNAPATGTVVDFQIPFPVSCVAVGPGSPGGQCVSSTSLNALVAGSIVSGFRMNWEVLTLQVQDGGADGNPSTTPNNPWLVRGLFQP